jgi:hypothetical protein
MQSAWIPKDYRRQINRAPFPFSTASEENLVVVNHIPLNVLMSVTVLVWRSTSLASLEYRLASAVIQAWHIAAYYIRLDMQEFLIIAVFHASAFRSMWVTNTSNSKYPHTHVSFTRTEVTKPRLSHCRIHLLRNICIMMMKRTWKT